MRKLIITLNFVSLIFLFAILSNISISLKPGVTGFATAVSSARFNFQPAFILAFLVILTTMVLNIYFLLSAKDNVKISSKK